MTTALGQTFKVGNANAVAIERCDLSELEKEVLTSDKKLVVKPYSFWKDIDRNTVSYFMLQHGIYTMPTVELIEWLRANIIGNAIEIGAGNGAIARSLNIPITDSKLQEEPAIKGYYLSVGQPIIEYHSDVEKLEAIEAIKKYKPDTVIGSFITHKWKEHMGNGDGNMFGVDEHKILKSVKRYINIGNLVTHKAKPILKQKHEELYFDWLVTRSVNQSENRIFIWNANG